MESVWPFTADDRLGLKEGMSPEEKKEAVAGQAEMTFRWWEFWEIPGALV